MLTKGVESPWFLNCAKKKDDAVRVRLFCFPFAGGSAASYFPLSRQITGDVDVFAVQLPGRATRFNEPCLSNLRSVVDNLTQAIQPFLDKPFVFFGHSMGALIAYEVCCALYHSQQALPQRLMLSACSAPHVKGRDKALHELPTEAFWQEIKTINGTPEAVLTNSELLELIEPTLRADFRLVYEWRQQSSTSQKLVLPVPFELFAGKDDPSVTPSQLQEWARYTTYSPTLHCLAGDHFFIHESSATLSNILSTSLASIG